MKRALKIGVTSLFAAAALMTLGPDRQALAQDYPDKTVLAVVPFGAGGGTDRWARVMASVGFDFFKSGMRIQNRGGASGTVGWKYMLDKGADGHTVLLASPTPVIAALLEKKPPFDPSKVKLVAYYSVMKPTVMAMKDKPYANWDGLIKQLKAGGKKLTIGGTITQTLGAASLLSQLKLIDRVILVPYSGTGKAVNDFLGGHIDLVTVTTSTAVSLAKKANAVVNATDLEYPKSAKTALGDVPNAKKLGLKPYNPPRFIAMHPDTPDEQVKAMSAKFDELMKSKPVTRLIGKLGEVIHFVPHEKGQTDYGQVLEDSKKYLPLFK